MEPSATLEDLPDEILQQILFYGQPRDTALNFQPVSRRLNRLANEPLLWRYYCRALFRYWDSKHNIKYKFERNVGEVDWKKLYIYRHKVEQDTSRALDGLIGSQTKHLEKYDNIRRYGYDAKDTLLRHSSVDVMIEDGLARRFYSTALLDHVQRAQALDEWWKLSNGQQVPLERALGAFDTFILHNELGDMDEISSFCEVVANQIRDEHPDIDTLTTRERAVRVVQYLRSNNLTGIDSEDNYYDLQNNYIGIALQIPGHPSLPLISTAIFCAVSQRLGLNAYPCGFPQHIYATIVRDEEIGEAEKKNNGNAAGEKGKQSSAAKKPNYALQKPEQLPIFFDPYRSDQEVPVDHLKSQLRAWGLSDAEFDRYLKPASQRNILLRTSRNILNGVRHLGSTPNLVGRPSPSSRLKTIGELGNAVYSAIWANFMLSSSSEQLRVLPLIMERFEKDYPMDAGLIDQYVCPPLRNLSTEDHVELLNALRSVRAADSVPKQIRSRDMLESPDRVTHHVGDVFRHRRYGYLAVITGWDVECTQNSQWMAQNGVDYLSRGRHQSFYHALVEDNTIRYVAEENIAIVRPAIPLSLMTFAGRYFKRWDEASNRFISNIRDEYPND